MRSRCQEEFLKKHEEKRPYRKPSYRVQRGRRRRRDDQPSATTTDVSTLASDLENNSSIGFETAEFNADDDDDNIDDTHAENATMLKTEQSHSEVDVLENIHFLNQSIDNLNDHLLMGEISVSAIAMINEATKRLKKLQQKLNGDSMDGTQDTEQDWMDSPDRNGQQAKAQYDISVNMCQNDANRLMQNGHMFFDSGKLCFSTRKKNA